MPHIHDLYDFTVSAYIVHPIEPKICLHLHKKFNKWMQIGGHVELNEDPLEALTHEMEEEAGLHRDKYKILQLFDQPQGSGYKQLPLPININVHPIEGVHQHIDIVYLVRSKVTVFKPQPNESQDIRWFTREQIEELKNKNMLQPGNYSTCIWILDKFPDLPK